MHSFGFGPTIISLQIWLQIDLCRPHRGARACVHRRNSFAFSVIGLGASRIYFACSFYESFSLALHRSVCPSFNRRSNSSSIQLKCYMYFFFAKKRWKIHAHTHIHRKLAHFYNLMLDDWNIFQVEFCVLCAFTQTNPQHNRTYPIANKRIIFRWHDFGYDQKEQTRSQMIKMWFLVTTSNNLVCIHWNRVYAKDKARKETEKKSEEKTRNTRISKGFVAQRVVMSIA